ncbi:MAG: PfkB family carbohydrate kinase [Opitutales bacterium]
MSSVVIVGSVAFDNIITPFARGEYLLGGSASYASIAASYFAPARLVANVGKDFEEKFLNRFRQRDICMEGLQIDPEGETFFWAGKYHDNFDQRDTLETRLNVLEHFRPELPAGYKTTPFVLLANIGPDLQIHLLDEMDPDTKPFVVADTMNLWIDIMRSKLMEMIGRVDLLVLNDEEAEMLTEERNVYKAGAALRKMGPTYVIVKKGSHGAILFGPNEQLFALPAYPVEDLQDPTGAGDSFAGALTGYLASKNAQDFDSIKQAMIYGTVTASYTVEAFSSDSLEAAGREGINTRAARLREIIEVD